MTEDLGMFLAHPLPGLVGEPDLVLSHGAGRVEPLLLAFRRGTANGEPALVAEVAVRNELRWCFLTLVTSSYRL